MQFTKQSKSSRLVSLSLQSLLVKNLRSEEHTSELQSRPQLVCRLLLEKKKELDPVRTQAALGRLQHELDRLFQYLEQVRAEHEPAQGQGSGAAVMLGEPEAAAVVAYHI